MTYNVLLITAQSIGESSDDCVWERENHNDISRADCSARTVNNTANVAGCTEGCHAHQPGRL